MYCVTYFDYDFKEQLVLSYHNSRFSALDKIEELATDFITPLETESCENEHGSFLPFYNKKQEPTHGYYIEKQLTNPYEIKIKKKTVGYFSNSIRKICSFNVIKTRKIIKHRPFYNQEFNCEKQSALCFSDLIESEELDVKIKEL